MELGNRFLTACIPLIAGPLYADWVTVRGGPGEEERILRGLDLEPLQAARPELGYRFSLENGEVIQIAAGDLVYVEKEPPRETVEFRGKVVTLREKIRILQKERREREAQIRRDIERWARGLADGSEAPDAETATARARVEALEPAARARAFAAALLGSELRDARRLAARELAAAKSPDAPRLLVRAALEDPFPSVRRESLAALERLADPETPGRFIPALRSRSPQVRTRAAEALARFPAPQAVDELIDTLHLTWAGFGRGYMMQVTQRAYIADYELVSGGTGFSIVEVADPVVRTNVTGVALDVDVRRVELRARLRALHRITGQNFGTDVERWRAWWKDNRKD
jgi:hypothetical protein